MPNAPRLIHFIWLGKPIPEKYLRNIVSLNAQIQYKGADKIDIILWCDTKMNVYRTANLIGLGLGNVDNLISIRTYKDDLLPNIETSDFYMGSARAKQRLLNFKLFTKLESSGAYNYATVSDIYRLEILRQFGGCYCDTDTIFLDINLKKTPSKFTSKPEILPLGFRANCSMRAVREERPLAEGDISLFVDVKLVNNDIIVAMRNDRFIRGAIDLILNVLGNLTTRKQQQTSSNAYIPNMYDLKRCVIFSSPGINKRSLSLELGPGIIMKCLWNVIDNYIFDILEGTDITVDEFKNLFQRLTVQSKEPKLVDDNNIFDKSKPKGTAIIAGEISVFGIHMKSGCDLTWLERPDKTRLRPRSYTL